MAVVVAGGIRSAVACGPAAVPASRNWWYSWQRKKLQPLCMRMAVVFKRRKGLLRCLYLGKSRPNLSSQIASLARCVSA